MQTVQQELRPRIWQLFRIWAGIGLQSFGGGASTSLLIQRVFIEKYHWLTMEEYAHLWNLSIFAPGINLVALTVLIGRKLGGMWGIIMSLIGMLLPSALVTCLLTVGFAQIEHISFVQAILQGVVPATAGIMLVVGLRFAEPQIKQAWQEGPLLLGISTFIILACALAIVMWQAPVFVVLPAVAIAGALLFKRPPVVQQDKSATLLQQEESGARD